MIQPECVTETTDSKISLTDKHSVTAIFLNQSRELHRRIELDGCVFKNMTACDWILEKPGVGRIVVELKGCDVLHAIQQVESGLNFLTSNGMSNLRMAALIVCTKYYSSPAFKTSIQRAKTKLFNNFKARLHITKDGRNLDFEKLLNESS